MKPLKNLVVLDLTRVLAGPYSAMMMGDFGANIIKIEQPGVGDDSRAFGPFVGKESAYYMKSNRNKRSMTLNFKEQGARDLSKKWLKKLMLSWKTTAQEQWKNLVGYDVLKEIKPDLIYAACSGFGETGPYKLKPAYDIIVQAMGGIMRHQTFLKAANQQESVLPLATSSQVCSQRLVFPWHFIIVL